MTTCTPCDDRGRAIVAYCLDEMDFADECCKRHMKKIISLANGERPPSEDDDEDALPGPESEDSDE